MTVLFIDGHRFFVFYNIGPLYLRLTLIGSDNYIQ